MTTIEKLRQRRKELEELLEVLGYLDDAQKSVRVLNEQYLKLTHERGVSRAARNAEEYLHIEAQRIEARIKSLREIIALREQELSPTKEDPLRNVWDIF